MAPMTIQQSIDSVQQSINKIISNVSEVPEETIRWKPSDDEWSIMQIVCHVLEAVPYWIGEIEQIQMHPEKQWGRNHLQEARLAAVENTKSRTIEEILKELTLLKNVVETELSLLDKDILAIEATSKNPNFGTKPISFIVDHLIVEHVSKHCRQIDRNLTKLN